MKVVGFAGPRSVDVKQCQPVVDHAVKAILSSNDRALVVGCASGIDAMVITAALQIDPKRLTIYAAFDQDGSLANSYSAVKLVQSAAEQGATVIWLAGGTTGATASRLYKRSQVMVDASSELVAITTGPEKRAWQSETRAGRTWRRCGSGTWNSTLQAIMQGKRATIYPFGQLATLPIEGEWIRHQGVIKDFYRYQVV